jgi:hypothetical protein
MAEQTYDYTALAAITCDACKQVEAGDTVEIDLDNVTVPALPASIRGIVQLVDDLTYTIQYDDADLLGAAAELTDGIVLSVSCVPCLTLAKEYAEAGDENKQTQIDAILASLAALGVIPGDGDNQFVVHPDSTPGVSVEAVRHDKISVANSGGSETIILDPADLVTPLAVSLPTGTKFRLEVSVSAISEKATDERDSAATFTMIGEFNAGATVQTVSLIQKDSVTLTGVKVGNNLHISLNNPSSGDITMFVTSKFRILS